MSAFTQYQPRVAPTAVKALTPTTGAVSWNVAKSPISSITTTGNATLTMNGGESGGRYVMVVTYGGSHTITFPANVKWPGGSYTPTGSGKDMITFVFDGTNFNAVADKAIA